MRIVIYVVILGLMLLAPVERIDVEKLLPIESVAIYMDGDTVVLETDTENKGRGESASDALENLKDMTPAVVYLDTAEYLLVSEEALSEADNLMQFLKPSVKVCICDARGRVKDVTKFLQAHENTAPL